RPPRAASVSPGPGAAAAGRSRRAAAPMDPPAESFGKLGTHAEIRYEDVRVGPEALLGEAGAGFLIAQHRLGPGRIHHCMRWLGVSRRGVGQLSVRAAPPPSPRGPPRATAHPRRRR